MDRDYGIPTSTVESLIQQNKNLSQQLNQIFGNQRALEIENEKLRNELFGLQAVDRERESDFRKIENAFAFAKQESELSKSAQSDLEKQFAELYSNSQAKEEIWTQELLKASRQIRSRNGFIRRVKMWVFPVFRNLRSENSDLKLKVQNQQEQLTQFKSQLTDAYEHIQKKNKEHHEIIHSRVNEHEQIETTLAAENENLRMELDSVKNELERIRASFERLQNHQATYENRVISAERRRDEMESKFLEFVKTSQEQILQERTKAKEFEIQSQRFEYEKKRSESELQKLQNDLKSLSEARCEERQEFMDFQKSIQTQNKRETDLSLELQRVSEEKIQLEAELLLNKAVQNQIKKSELEPEESKFIQNSVPHEKDDIAECIQRLSEQANKLILY